jgi:DNA-binding IclR family transcriptional regulator
LRGQLDEMRSRGTAITIDHITPGVWACAAPIIDNDKVIAALSVAGPAFRIDKGRRSRFQATVKTAAAAISSNLGEKQWPPQRRLTA